MKEVYRCIPYKHLPTIIFIWLLISLSQHICTIYIQAHPTSSHEKSKEVNLISILDASTLDSCLIKIYSMHRSALKPILFVHHFLLMDNSSIIRLQESLQKIIPNNKVIIKLWSDVKPLTFPTHLKKEKFEQDHIFARFYLPDIFAVDRFIYTDNDLFVSGDMEELFDMQLFGNIFSNNVADRIHPWAAKEQQMRSVGMVYECHPQYKVYIANSFNINHTMTFAKIDSVQSTLVSKRTAVFLNAGLFIVDCIQWKREKLTQRAELIMLENFLTEGGLYSTSSGDQGLFFILLGRNAFGLPPQWNMRRLPKKTVHMLEGGAVLGAVHLAGSTGGRSTWLCEAPTQYPIFLPAVVPLYLSIVRQFLDEYHALNWTFSKDCLHALGVVKTEIAKQGITVSYKAGKGCFSWPPLNEMR